MIGQLLGANDHLKELLLEDNGLTDELLAGLASGLRANRSLSRLSLENNHIAGAFEIAQALGHNTSPTSLDRRDHMTSSAVMWSEVLVDRSTPFELNLKNCPLRGDALVDLGLALSRQCLIKKLQLGYYFCHRDLFTSDGIGPFLKSVQMNVHLKELEISPDSWDGVAFDALVEVLPCCVALRSLKTNRLCSAAQKDRQQRFLDSLRKNKSLFRVQTGHWPCSQRETQFYMLRNRVDYALGADSAATRPVLLEGVLGWPQDHVGLSVVMSIFKTCPTILDSVRRGITRPQCASADETSGTSVTSGASCFLDLEYSR